MTPSGLRPIPWEILTGDTDTVWTWDTPSFLVTITGNRRSFYWTIGDKTSNPGAAPRPFADSFASSFDEAEAGIRETIGKAYDPALGYLGYSGPLATTFTIASGEKVDLGQYVGAVVTVTVADGNGGSAEYRGTASVQHYDFVITEDDGTTLHITPSYILQVTQKAVGGVLGPARYLGIPQGNRTMEGTVTLGCTGMPGFIAGTIDHSGPPCPIHE